MNKKTVISCVVAALFVSGTALATPTNPTPSFPVEETEKAVYEQTTGSLVFVEASTAEVQTTGGYWIGNGKNVDKAALVFGDAAYTVEATGDDVTGYNLDSLIGGNYLRDATIVKSATVGNTSLTVKGTTSEYIVGGSKAASIGDAGTLTNGNVTLTLIDAKTKDFNKNKGSDNANVIGGNYIKNHNTKTAVEATVGDVNVTIQGSSHIKSKVFGGSFAEHYVGNKVTDEGQAYFAAEVTLKAKSGNLNTTITGGTFDGHVIAGSGASGKGTSVTNGTSSITLDSTGNTNGITLTDKKVVLVGGSYVDRLGTATTNGDTNVVVKGDNTITLGKGIVGGTLAESNSYTVKNAENKNKTVRLPHTADYAAATITGSTHITVDAAKAVVKDEIIGGNYLRAVSTSPAHAITATVKDTHIDLKAGTFEANVIGGGKVAGDGGKESSTVTGDTFITMSGGTAKALLVGGGSAKMGENNSSASFATANVNGTSHVTLTNGTVTGIVGGGLSYAYDPTQEATIEANSKHTQVVITGGTIKGPEHNSGEDTFNPQAAVIGGGLAYVKVKDNVKAKAINTSVESTQLLIQGKDVNIYGDVFAGGYAEGKNADSTVKTASVVVKDVVLGKAETTTEDRQEVNIYAGGYAGNEAKASTETAAVTIQNATVIGSVYAGGKSVAADGTKPAGTAPVTNGSVALTDAKVDGKVDVNNVTKSALVFTGANEVSTVDGKADDITFNATKARQAVLTLGDEGSIDMSKDKEIVVTNAQAGTTLVDGKVSVAEDTQIKVRSDFGETVFTVTEALTDATDLTLTGAGLAVGESTIKPAELKVSTNSKTLSEAYLGSLAFVNQGAEFIADEGLRAIRAAAKPNAFTAFGAMTGGQSKYETGSNVKVKGVTLAAGTAGQFGNTTVAGFVEAGWASSDSNVSGTKADADHDYYGVGALVRYDFDVPFYLDGSLRIGQVSTEFDGSFGAGKAKYDADSLYTTAHFGGGYVFDLAPGVKLDAYGRYVLSYLKGDDVTLDSAAREGFDMDDTTTHAVRIGARVTGEYQAINWYTGLAYEHVFDGKAEGKLNTYGISAALDAPELKGDSAILDLGFTMKPSETSPFTMGLGLKGYAGDRKGVSGNMSVLYTF